MENQPHLFLIRLKQKRTFNMIEPWDHTETYKSHARIYTDQDRYYDYNHDKWVYPCLSLDQFNEVKIKIKFLRQNLKRANGRTGTEKKEINVSLDYIYNIGEKQNWKCALTNVPLEFIRGGRMFNNMWANPNSCTIDRIDSSLGYVEGNIQLLTWKANCVKAGMHHQEFIKFCYDVVETDKKRKYQLVQDNCDLLNEQKSNTIATIIRNYLNREKKYFDVQTLHD